MKIFKIPIRNISMITEKRYLEEKLAKGLKLVNRGLFFYKFEKVSSCQGSVGIDLVPTMFNEDGLEIEGWEYRLSHKSFLSKYKKVYYDTTEPDLTISVDEGMVMDFYSVAANRASSVLILSSIGAILILLAPVYLDLLGIDRRVPASVLLGAVALAVVVGVVAAIYDKAAMNSRKALNPVAFQKVYSVRLRKGVGDLQKQQVEEKMKSLGSHVMSSKNGIMIRTSLTGEDVRQELLALDEVTLDDFTIWNMAGRWSVQV
ncbi:MAG: DUF2812 domain-containing protein [Turicibacter sp.]|nr:DUF2812 domain-containing protein [Turicibacter sp.]